MDTDSGRHSSRYLAALTLGALGVVYGDIGTSPLYAIRECFFGPHAVALTAENVIGILSLVIWELIVVVTVQYLIIILRADNGGEGGVVALTALLQRPNFDPVIRRVALFIGIFGAALLFGDGVVTPAISVLSAVEGLEVVAPALAHWVVPVTTIILIGLFAVQKHGTERIGYVFGPVILLWFTVLGVLGIRGVMMLGSFEPLLQALNPGAAVSFLIRNGAESVAVLGSVFLVVTGAEALFADMGHFGRAAIRLGWFAVVLPGLFLNYLGQSSFLLVHLNDPEIRNPFYQLAPEWGRMPLIFLSMCATFIASQALISGAFSMTQQTIQLGFLPRLHIAHTSSKEMGQIYVPVVNWILLVITVVLVLEFRTSSALAGAYGISVSGTMLITSILIYFVARHVWQWPLWKAALILVIFGTTDLVFLLANAVKLMDGGWVPVAIGIVMFVVMTTWRRGREILAARLLERARPMDAMLELIKTNELPRVPGVAVFMARDIDRVPTALLQNVRHNKMLHEQIVMLRILTEDEPLVPEPERSELKKLCDGFYACTLRYGFMETPHVPDSLKGLEIDGEKLDLPEVTFYLGREIILATNRPGMAIWRERLFRVLSALSLRAPMFYQIPSDQVIEIGTQIEM